MRALPVAELDQDAAVLDRRKKRGRRASDLEGAYNDGGRPSTMTIANAVGLYGGLAWIVVTSAIGTFFVLKSAWNFLSLLWPHG